MAEKRPRGDAGADEDALAGRGGALDENAAACAREGCVGGQESEKEVHELRAANARLEKEVDELKAQLARERARAGGVQAFVPPPPQPMSDGQRHELMMDALRVVVQCMRNPSTGEFDPDVTQELHRSLWRVSKGIRQLLGHEGFGEGVVRSVTFHAYGDEEKQRRALDKYRRLSRAYEGSGVQLRLALRLWYCEDNFVSQRQTDVVRRFLADLDSQGSVVDELHMDARDHDDFIAALRVAATQLPGLRRFSASGPLKEVRGIAAPRALLR